MEKRNDVISALQYAAIGSFLGNALFVGLGNTITISLTRQDSWITTGIALLIGMIPMLLMLYIINHYPALNIFDKNKKIFGAIIGHILNFVISIIILIMLVICVWSLSNYATTKYLTETPSYFVALLFIIPAIYACIKGIETIGRISEILFFFSIIIISLIVFSLITYSDFNNMKPILANGFNPFIEGTLKYLSYSVLPFFMLLVVPKKDIADSKKCGRYFILGFVISALSMFLVFYMTISVLGVNLVSLYRYPEYYVIKKVMVLGVIKNVENFFSIHWLFNMFIFITMGVYFVSEYVKNILKFKKEKTRVISIIIVGLISVIGSMYIFPNSTVGVNFMKFNYPFIMALPLMVIIVLTTLVIYNKKKA